MACCCCSVSKSCPTLCDTINSSMQIFPVLHYLQELAQTYVHWVGDANQAFHSHCPLLLLPSVFPIIRVFSNESALHVSWPKYWSFSISPSDEYSGLVSFRIDWLDLAVQETLKSLLQHYSLKASILWLSDFFMVHLSHLSMTMENHSLDYMDLCRQSDVSAF